MSSIDMLKVYVQICHTGLLPAGDAITLWFARCGLT